MKILSFICLSLFCVLIALIGEDYLFVYICLLGKTTYCLAKYTHRCITGSHEMSLVSTLHIDSSKHSIWFHKLHRVPD